MKSEESEKRAGSKTEALSGKGNAEETETVDTARSGVGTHRKRTHPKGATASKGVLHTGKMYL